MGVISNFKSSVYRELTKLRFEIIALALRSNGGVRCPICGYKGFTFLPYGLDKRPNAFCQVCHSKERQRLTALQIGKLGLRNKSRLLHVAPDPELSHFLKRQYSLIETKIDKRVPGYTYPKSTITMDLTNLTIEDSSFDLAICLHVLSYIEDDIKAMRELYRVLDKDGVALFTVPQDLSKQKTISACNITDREERHKLFGHPDVVRLYGRDFGERLSTVGFEVEEFAVGCNFSQNEIFKYGLISNDSIFIAKKKYGS
jgi:hypothetical protein